MIKEVVNAPIIADTLLRSRARINELRSNFTVRDRACTWRVLDNTNFLKLVSAMEANLNTYRITESLADFDRKPASTLQFRSIPLGDINLLRDIAPSMGPQKIKIYIARINGEHSNMTVVQYREEKEKWASDFARYSSMRHPNVWQLFGISTAPALHSLIFHDELMPLAVYRMPTGRRPILLGHFSKLRCSNSLRIAQSITTGRLTLFKPGKWRQYVSD
ncbi:hypothetical protein B0H13DRAFT_857969 [Mycena leptocephala]|nr:hypothetical protein B0H13DRAFT_857969 [Mycena leptocephala]